MRIHIVAVSGTGMGPLAGLLASLGHQVRGSDVAFDPPIGPLLRQWGIECLQGFSPAHVADRPELVVIGNLCRPDNPEARAAIDGGLDYTHIAGALERLVLPGTRPLVVTGTHGKTTTAALCAGLLEGVGLEPGYLIGGVPQGLESSFRAPRSERRKNLLDARARSAPFVIEGDEYDTAFFEKTAKFLHYSAQIAIITSIEHDHVDIYPTFDDYLRPFAALVSGLPENGLIVANAADERVVSTVRKHARAEVVWYALEGQTTFGVTPHWSIAPAGADAAGTSFDLFLGGVSAGRWVSRMSGLHNLSNIAAALAAVTHGYGVEISRLRAPLSQQRGVKRRQELLGTPGGVRIYDDFAHHPTAVRETLRALRARHAGARLFCVFEPRSATACRNVHQAAYPDALAAADVVLLARVARELPDSERLDVARVTADLKQRGVAAEHFEAPADIVSALCRDVREGDVVAVLSNGAFGGLHGQLLDALRERAKKASVQP